MNSPPPIRGPFRTDDVARAVYAESAGVLQLVPRAVAIPLDADDVVTLLRWAAAERVPLVARGSGSSMGGGAVGDGVIVDCSRLLARQPVDVVRRTVWVGSGVLRRDVEHDANGAALRFPVDPSSGTFATIGGMASTNAAGPRTLAFGAMRRWVEAAECVFADGSRATIRRGAPLPVGVPALDRWSAAKDELRAAAAALPEARVRKESSGYGVRDFAASGELLDLLVGSEGTLALFTALELRLTAVPAATATVLAAFPSLEQSVVGAALAREHGATACELLDRTFLDIARRAQALPVPDDTEAVLLIELEEGMAPAQSRESTRPPIQHSPTFPAKAGTHLPVHRAPAPAQSRESTHPPSEHSPTVPAKAGTHTSEHPALSATSGAKNRRHTPVGPDADAGVAVADRARSLAAACEANGASGVLVGLDAESEEALWALRHAASPILSRLDPNLKSMQVVEDGCVPPERLGDYVRGVRNALAESRLRGVIFGHAGDAHVHVNALVDVRDDDWRERIRLLFDNVVALTATLGGTIAGEHGDGRWRTPALAQLWPPSALALFERIKAIFDPAGILNPGVKVHPLTCDLFAQIKYDPTLPALPEAARAVLERVERERAYDASRLEMLTSPE
ncbi:MAG: FAD-binding oxidoreductase [Gemmatimonadaceae bacterium]|nr:FAD-binding oxidoreductase [Gemmatimonadaceae bacterium]